MSHILKPRLRAAIHCQLLSPLQCLSAPGFHLSDSIHYSEDWPTQHRVQIGYLTDFRLTLRSNPRVKSRRGLSQSHVINSPKLAIAWLVNALQLLTLLVDKQETLCHVFLPWAENVPRFQAWPRNLTTAWLGRRFSSVKCSMRPSQTLWAFPREVDKARCV